jgi:hypothetical protein
MVARTLMEEKLMKVTWPQVVLILGIVFAMLATTILLRLIGDDAGNILLSVVTSLMVVLGALGLVNNARQEAKIDQVTEMSNGRLNDVMEDNRKMRAELTQMALMVTVPPPSLPEPSSNDHTS